MLTNAIAGVARSGVTRSGYPVLLGAKVPLYALSNVARSGATRSNYTSSHPFISIDGIHRAWGHRLGEGVIADSLTKSDQISGTADTLAFTAYGWVPIEGQDVIVTIGSANNDTRVFGGTILATVHRYAGKPAARNMLFDVSCIDYTWGLNRYKVSGNYSATTVGAVAAALMTYAPGYTLLVDPDIAAERLDQITFTEQELAGALAQLVKRVGGEYLCDYHKQVHLFFENTTITAPTIINAVHPTLHTIQWTRDLSQVATRCYGVFGGSEALDAIAPGASLLPVQTAAWYVQTGGRVLVGQQRITYGGIVGAGGGSLVGPGASPTGAPNATLLPGAGVDVGSHDYAVTFKTVNGESIPGPRLTVPVGVFLPPPTAPTPGAPGPGAGPDPGVHDYAVAFVIATGETVPGPRIAASTDLLAPPTTAPTPDRVDPGLGPDPGPHDYAVSFVAAASGETPAGPIGGQITTGTQLVPVTPPTAAPTLTQTAGSTNRWAVGDHVQVGITFVTANGETTIGPLGATTITAPTNQVNVTNIPIGPPGTTARRLYRIQVTGTVPTGNIYQYALADNTTTVYNDLQVGFWYSSSGQLGPPSNTAGSTPRAVATVHLTQIPKVPSAQGAGATRRIYRRSGGAGLRLVATLPDNSATTYDDTTPNAGLGAAPPTDNTAVLRQIPLTKIPIGNALVLSRKIYRTPANTGGGTLKLVTTIADNATTDYVDTVPDASLGAPALTVGTAQAAQVQLSAIPLGAAAVTARVVYRTKAGAAQLQTLVTLADNTTTAYLDVILDAALGANAPSSDTSLLQQPTGNVMAGSPTLPCATVAAFRPAGGWAIVGSQNIRYTGISGNALLGIPPSGPGAITATISFNTTATAAAMLTGIPTTGVGAIKYQILKGDAVNLFVQVDDLEAQEAVRAQLAGSDGIIEDEIQDGRLSYTEGVARCRARLDLVGALDSEGKVGVISVSYVCRDLNTQAGAIVDVNLGAPVNLRGAFRIQRVTVSRFNVPNLHPAFTVEASSLRFSAEELLRLIRQEGS